MATKQSAKYVASKLEKVTNAWTTIRPDKSFAGMTLDQFKATVKPSLDLRDKETDLRNGLKDVRTQRPVVDAGSLDQTLLVVNAVKGDPAEGENGTLYAAMGYVPKYAKRSGLTRKGQTTAPAAPTVVAPAATPTTTAK